MLTKNDIQAIKKLLKPFATKNDLIGLAKGAEIDELKFVFIDNLAKWKSELFDKIDKVLGRIITAEEENVILQAREEARQQIKRELESRLKRLESLHPHGQHQYP